MEQGIFTISENLENSNQEKSESLESANTSARFSPLLRQILAVSGPFGLIVASGMTFGFSAILLPQLHEGNDTIAVTTEQSSWIASMVTLPMAISCVSAGIVIEKLGRKMTHIAISVPFIIGWIIIGMATNVEMILAGRFITGACVGVTAPAASVYIAEVSAPKYRGILLGTISVGVAFGIFVCHVLGTYMAWQTVAYISVAVPAVSGGLMMLVPESPTWLANNGKKKKAEEAFFWCRGRSVDAVKELSAMMQKLTHAQKSTKISWHELQNQKFWKLVMVMIVFFVTMQFAGINAIAFYSVTIMQETMGDGLNEYTATFIIDIIRIIASVLACVLTRKFGRRPLTNISNLGTAASLIFLSAFLFASKRYPLVANFSAIPISALVCYIIFVQIGLFPLPWTMSGEVFPQNLRGIGSGIAMFVNFVAFFVVIKINPAMNSYLQPYGTFLTYACATIIGGCVLYVFLPETKGKTLQEIEEQFQNKVAQNVKAANVV